MYLLDNGASVYTVDNDGFGPLHRAAETHDYTAFLALVERGIDVNLKVRN